MRACTVTQKIKIKKSFADGYKNKNCLRGVRYRWPIRSALPTPSKSKQHLMLSVGHADCPQQPARGCELAAPGRQLYAHPLLYARTPLYELWFVDNVDSLLMHCPQCPHGARAKMRGAKVWTLWTVLTPDLNRSTPICLIFNHMGFSFVHLYYPQYPQTPQTLDLQRFPRGSRPIVFAVHSAIHAIHKTRWRENPTKTCGLYLVR